MKLLALLALLPLADAQAATRAELLTRFKASCNEVVAENYKNHKDICACITTNLAGVYTDEELELMTLSHEGDPESEAALQKDENSRLIDIDYDVTEGCMENVKFKYRK